MKTEKTTMENVLNLIEKSVTLKLVTITILMLLLLIPATMIQSIISEREQLNQQATAEVSSKWANSQQINGPILTVPVVYEHEMNGEIIENTRYWHLLPENLKIEGNIEPKKLKRGIYEVVVYGSNLSVSGNFQLDLRPETTNLKAIQYHQAFLTVGISDLRGIRNPIDLLWGKENLMVQPGSKISEIVYSGITIDIPDLQEKQGQNVEFQFSLDLQGSQDLSFTPVGSHTEVQLASPWPSPSFNGNFLPDLRTVDGDGFNATWSVLQINRNFPQWWMGNSNAQMLNESAFGVDLILTLDDYQKSFRSAKYAAMTIALTFLTFFLVEILNRQKIHAFQYALVGLALCLFYTLLVSISEHSNFNLAYGISTLGIVAMIALYSLTIFKSRILSLLLILVLGGVYGFLFVTLQLADYALLLGSIGLTLILGATMYFTRNINWYRLSTEPE